MYINIYSFKGRAHRLYALRRGETNVHYNDYNLLKLLLCVLKWHKNVYTMTQLKRKEKERERMRVRVNDWMIDLDL